MTNKAKNYVQSMIKSAAAKDGAGFKTAFDKAMTQRVGAALEQTRQEIAQNTFGGIKEGETYPGTERETPAGTKLRKAIAKEKKSGYSRPGWPAGTTTWAQPEKKA